MDNDQIHTVGSNSASDTDLVGLLVENDENCRQLATWFRKQPEFTSRELSPSASPPETDLVVVDEPSVARYQDWLQSRKDQADSQFYPILLVYTTDDPSFTDSVWEIIDDTVSAPVDPPTLEHRLENLMERRRLSENRSTTLERTEARYSAVFEAVNDAILVIDAEEDSVLNCNSRATDVLGYAESELVALSPAEDLYPTNADAYECFIDRVIDEGKSQTVELVCKTGYGSEIEVEASASPLDCQAGSRVVFSICDVTEHPERARRIESQRDRPAQLNRINRTLHETTRAVVQAANRDDLETAVCRNLSESGAYQFAWIGERSDDDTIVPRAMSDDAADYLDDAGITTDDTPTGRGPSGRALETTSVCTVQNVSTAPEMEPWRESLSRFGVKSTAAIPIHYDDEVFSILNLYTHRKDAFVGDERDVLANLGKTIGRAIADIRAREDAQIFQHAVEHAGQAIYITDPDGTIQYVNSAFVEMTGYSREAVLGRNQRILESGAHDQEFYRDLWQTVLSGETWRSEIINRHKSGRRQHVDQTIAPVKMGTDSIDYLVAINAEITDKRRRQQQLQVLYRVLRHNVRNRLNVIEGYADLLADSGTSGPRSALEQISQAVDDLLQISRQARRIERTFTEDSGERTMRTLDAVVQDAVADATAPDSVITTTIPDTSLKVEGDLERAIRELTTNGFKHNDAEDAAVAVTVATTGREATPRGTVTIRDNGPGIPEQERAVLREGEETPLLHGNGLGLWLVNWVVTELGGTIDIRDADPQGSIVTISVPLID
ncbi:PAS domain S-box protein [Halobacterium jilantaiense]|uniref:PAS domain S-box-containing protein n=1 Tax=Halobacterium jilantaiense TaxID=355548 RepID=A0A1I0R374_9EURY|nr:PAS domain S-box protein [Halobacterium jilantaiense]SEW34817.1 PAS domain S-box-containing protein [Halobacterium jilantaiense]